jgi:hypothetical protein
MKYTYLPMKMEQIQCSETLAFKIQTPGNHPTESIRHSEHCEFFKSGRYLLVPGIEPRLTVSQSVAWPLYSQSKDGLKKLWMFFEEDSRSLSQESPVLDIPNIVPRICVLIIQISRQAGPTIQQTTSWENCSHLELLHGVYICLCCNTNYMKQPHLAAIQVRVRWHLAFNVLNTISVCLRLQILCCYFAECNNNSHHLFVWCHEQGSEWPLKRGVAQDGDTGLSYSGKVWESD